MSGAWRSISTSTWGPRTGCSISWAERDATRHLVVANDEAVISPVLVDPHGRGHRALRLHLGDGRREPGVYRHERPRHLPSCDDARACSTSRARWRSSPAPTPGIGQRHRARRWPRPGPTIARRPARSRCPRRKPRSWRSAAASLSLEADLARPRAGQRRLPERAVASLRRARHPGQQCRDHPPRRRSRLHARTIGTR